MRKTLITERSVKDAARHNKIIEIPKDALITALARDAAKKLGLTFKFITDEPGAHVNQITLPLNNAVAIGCDHGGYALKLYIIKVLQSMQYQAVDVGTHSAEAVDYPDFALAVARLVAEGKCFRGIMIDGAGIGSCIVVNKVKGIRGAMCYDITSAINSREHNDANVLTLGSKMIGEIVAEHIVRIWLKTDFAGGRHQKRIDKIINAEKDNLK